jgi:hypothetical protein
MKIGSDVGISKKTSGLNAKDHQDFEKFVEERKRKRMKQEETEEKLTSRMPEEGQQSDDAMADDRAKLAEEKSAYTNKRQKTLQDIETEENE